MRRVIGEEDAGASKLDHRLRAERQRRTTNNRVLEPLHLRARRLRWRRELHHLHELIDDGPSLSNLARTKEVNGLRKQWSGFGRKLGRKPSNLLELSYCAVGLAATDKDLKQLESQREVRGRERQRLSQAGFRLRTRGIVLRIECGERIEHLGIARLRPLQLLECLARFGAAVSERVQLRQHAAHVCIRGVELARPAKLRFSFREAA